MLEKPCALWDSEVIDLNLPKGLEAKGLISLKGSDLQCSSNKLDEQPLF